MNTKVLFINPMSAIEGFLPIGLSYLIAVLHNAGFKLDIFDTTYYEIGKLHDREKNELFGEFLPVDMSEYNVTKKSGDYIDDLNIKIQTFRPNLIAVPIATAFNVPLALELINNIKNCDALVIVGGKAVTLTPEKFIVESNIDIVGIGESEAALLELCQRLENKQDYSDIKNLWVKINNKIIKNEMRPLLQDLNTLPIPNWDYFDKRHFYKPFMGKIYRYGHMELSRGCPYKCSYCANERLQKIYAGLGKYCRRKSVDRIVEESSYLKKKYNLGLIKFWDEEFLSLDNKTLKRLAFDFKKYVDVPIIVNIRLDSVTEYKVDLLKYMGCVNASFGIETGNQKLRKEVLNRRMSNEVIKKGVAILNKYDIRSSSLNMIGIPFETRKNVFETIELNRKTKAQNSSIMILQPWDGTTIKKIAIDNGFMSKDNYQYSYTDTCLNMPSPYLSRQDTLGLTKTFSLYRKVPKILYPLVKLCEKDGKYRDKLFKFLHKTFKSH